MTSPIHSFLFSPPPSPPLPMGAAADPNRSFSPLRSLLPAVLRSSLDSVTAPRSPKLSGNSFLPSLSTPSRSGSPSGTKASVIASMRGLEAIDVEAANQPTYRPRRLSPLLSPRLLKGRTIPRPISRLVAFVVLVFSGVMLLQSLSEAFFPAATPEEPMSVVNNHYVAPQAAAMHYRPLVAAPPRTERPHNHPLPESHELLVLQSFVLESRYHFLSNDVDPSKPLDASDMIGDAARRLGQTGSEREREWLQEIEDENASNVVVWYASSSVPHYATDGIISRHGEGHRPTLLAIAGRPDADIVGAVFERLGLNLDVAPVVIIGGQPIHATEEVMHHLRASGELAAKLESIGWRR